MIIKKVFNNNCVLTDIDSVETVITGSGVGFQRKPGDMIDPTLIEKKFEIIDEYLENFEMLVMRVPISYFNLTQRIAEYATEVLNVSMDTKITISLTDHISYAINRSKEGIVMPALFNREIHDFYPEEYGIGLWALDIIEKSEGVKLPIEEASFIALHIINAATTSEVSHVAQAVTRFIQDCINLIEETLNIRMDRDSITFSRMVTHLKYLAKRIVEGTNAALNTPSRDFVNKMLLRFSSSKLAVEAIAVYVKEHHDYVLDDDERLYLSIHIYQLVSKS